MPAPNMIERLDEIITMSGAVCAAIDDANRIKSKIKNNVIPEWEIDDYREALAEAEEKMIAADTALRTARLAFLEDFGAPVKGR